LRDFVCQIFNYFALYGAAFVVHGAILSKYRWNLFTQIVVGKSATVFTHFLLLRTDGL
jgi:hypothetical protein